MIVPISAFKEVGSDLTPNWVENTIKQHYKDLIKKKDDFIRGKFIEKGFGHLTEGMEKRRFSKILCVKQGGWEYYYADNNTDEGAFIVAIKESIIGMEHGDMLSTKITASFQWQDNFPL